jgi:hypothetical protein
MAQAQARRNLEHERLLWGTVRESYSDKVPKGYVIATVPGPGTQALAGFSVDVEVSRGPHPKEPTVAPPAPLPPTPEPNPGGTPVRTGSRQSIAYMVPSSIGKAKAKITIDLTDDHGQRTLIYEGFHQGEALIPTQTFTVTSPSVLRIYVNDKVMVETPYRP